MIHAAVGTKEKPYCKGSEFSLRELFSARRVFLRNKL